MSRLTLPIKMPFPPMEAQSVDEIPTEGEWQYEPKWDGFRCAVFRDGDSVELQSRAGQPLTRYFPEVVESVKAVKARQFVLDGELMVTAGRAFSFDDLLQRIHPAASRVARLSAEIPATLVVFDLLVDDSARSLVDLSLSTRRPALEEFAERFLRGSDGIHLSPATRNASEVKRWFRTAGGGLDGVIAKQLDSAYRSGERKGMRTKSLEYGAQREMGAAVARAGHRGAIRSLQWRAISTWDPTAPLASGQGTGAVHRVTARERKGLVAQAVGR